MNEADVSKVNTVIIRPAPLVGMVAFLRSCIRSGYPVTDEDHKMIDHEVSQALDEYDTLKLALQYANDNTAYWQARALAIEGAAWEVMRVLDFARQTVRPRREVGQYLFGREEQHFEHAAIPRLRDALSKRTL